MKRQSITLLMIIGTIFISDAQITLPYTNGFDTNNQIDDWVLYRKGLTVIDGNPSHNGKLAHRREPLPPLIIYFMITR